MAVKKVAKKERVYAKNVYLKICGFNKDNTGRNSVSKSGRRERKITTESI